MAGALSWTHLRKLNSALPNPLVGFKGVLLGGEGEIEKEGKQREKSGRDERGGEERRGEGKLTPVGTVPPIG